jgi:hypothetical protein
MTLETSEKVSSEIWWPIRVIRTSSLNITNIVAWVGIVTASSNHYKGKKSLLLQRHDIVLSVTSLPLQRHKNCTGYFVPAGRSLAKTAESL